MAGNRSVRPLRKGLMISLLLGGACALLNPTAAWPWGCEGHQAVAIIAEKHMSPRALAMANELLRSQPIDPTLKRFCTEPGLDPMADAATWADDLKGSRPETSPWHYIDIPRGGPRSALAESCPAATGCVTRAIEHQLDLLRNEGTDGRVRADALRFVIHLVGDLHQPLHCTTNDDMGGNCVPVAFFGNPPAVRNPQYETYAPNLHAIWDYGMIQRMKGSESVKEWAAKLDQQFSAQMGAWQRGSASPEDWAWESHKLAETAVYGQLPVPVPIEKPEPVDSCSADNHIAQRMLNLHEEISQRYQDAVATVIEEQIARAGIRLAMILNQLWP